MLSDNGFTLKDYWSFSIEDTEKYDNLAHELVASCLIVKNCTSNRAHTYLKENYFVGAKNYPSTRVATVALITSFGPNSDINGVSGGGEKDTNKPNAVVSLHPADDNLVESFESDGLNDERTSSDNMSIADASITNGELENNITDDVVTGDDGKDDNDDNNNVDDDASDDNSSEVC